MEQHHHEFSCLVSAPRLSTFIFQQKNCIYEGTLHPLLLLQHVTGKDQGWPIDGTMISVSVWEDLWKNPGKLNTTFRSQAEAYINIAVLHPKIKGEETFSLRERTESIRAVRCTFPFLRWFSQDTWMEGPQEMLKCLQILVSRADLSVQQKSQGHLGKGSSTHIRLSPLPNSDLVPSSKTRSSQMSPDTARPLPQPKSWPLVSTFLVEGTWRGT